MDATKHLCCTTIDVIWMSQNCKMIDIESTCQDFCDLVLLFTGRQIKTLVLYIHSCFVVIARCRHKSFVQILSQDF